MRKKRSIQKFKVPYIGKGSIYGQEEKEYINRLLDNNATLSCGSERDNFEKLFADFIGVKHALSLTNCTIALEFATYLSKLTKNDEVIVAPFTYQANAQSLLTQSANIKFCDIDPNSLCADIKSISNLISENTRAVYITHYGGMMVEIDRLKELAKKYHFLIIEDCAHAIGSTYKGIKAGALGDIGCFSFQSGKNISTLGEGGMITFNNSKWLKILRNIRAIEVDAIFKEKNIHFGEHITPPTQVYMHEKNSYTHECVEIFHHGTNSTMGEVAAAVGSIQLKKLYQFNERRRQIAHYLTYELSQLEEIRVQEVPVDFFHTYHLYTFFLKPSSKIKRDEFAQSLYQKGVEIILRYFPIHLLPEWRFRGGKYGQCPVTEQIWFNELINLPCYPQLTEDEVNYMICKIKESLYECIKQKRMFYS